MPENETEARSVIADLIPFLKATYSPWFLQFFLEEAKLRYTTSMWDPETRFAYSSEEAELDRFLGKDDETFISEGTTFQGEKITPEIEINTPPVDERESFPKRCTDDDSVSTFNPSGTRNSMNTSTVFTSKVLNLDKPTSLPKAPSVIPANVTHMDSDAISKFSDAESRLSSLESQFEAFNCGLKELKKQSIKEAKRNEKVLANILALLQKEEGSASLPNTSSTGLNVPSSWANLPSKLTSAGSTSEVAAGGGS